VTVFADEAAGSTALGFLTVDGPKLHPMASIHKPTGIGRDDRLPQGRGTILKAALSPGMGRQMTLARAIAIAPDLLILDKPFVSLDARTPG
jgi:hypothetical protein